MKQERRLTPVSQLTREAIAADIFSVAGCEASAKGQHGVFVHLRKGTYRALLRVESSRQLENYPSMSKLPTRISYLSVEANGRPLGIFDYECFPPRRHRFEAQARRDPKLQDFLEHILRYFG
jgi:hypothetical protein